MKAELIQSMGSDLTVVNAARVSFDKESEWQYCSGTEEQYYCDDRCVASGEQCPRLKEKDQKLISYLARNSHWTPFAHCMITLRETVPIFVARQRFKHTVGFVYNEVSRRYVDTPPEFYYPEVLRKRADNKKQGSSDEPIEKNNEFLTIYNNQITDCVHTYYALLNEGVAPEQARMVLPQSMYTSYYVTGSLAAWARAYNLRTDPHAQLEIQEFAKEWGEIIKPLYPVSWTALCESS